MTDSRAVVTAASLRATTAWRFPHGAEILWQQEADSGTPHGYDDLDRAAFVAAFVRVSLAWAEVLEFYRQHFERLGWPTTVTNEGQVLGATTEGVSIAVILQPRRPGFWAPPGAYDQPGTVFELSVRSDRRPT